MPLPMRTLFFLILFVMPTAIFAAHTGVTKVRTQPELSDVALFVLACIGVWIVRRALRARFAGRRGSPRKD
jgi:hypothetical protein